MQINRIYKDNTNFKGFLNNKYLLKGLEKVSEHGTSFSAGTALAMSLTVRPLAIFSTPDVEKENKQYACSNSICSGLIKFGMVEAIALPIENAVKKIDANPDKYLKQHTKKIFQDTADNLVDSKSYKLATQIIKLSTGFITAVPKSILTIALIPIIMDKIFNLKIGGAQEKSVAPSKKTATREIPFTGRITEKLPEHIGKILDFKPFQDFAKKHQNNDKNIAKHITAATDILLSLSFACQTDRSKKIKENRKKALIYNNWISTGITLGLGYGIDSLAKNKTNKFIEAFSKANAKDPKLAKYIEGLNIVRPAIIFAAIYYGLLPVISTYLAEKTDKYIQNK